ncbi:MAG: DMT family transporter [Simkaniaceae bacterium]|nr:MAG: DMT family transporter [Simkaniaceae bacterium]
MKERITHRIWFGIIVSFVGVILVLQPGSGLFKYQALWALVSGVSMAASQAFNRKVAQQVPSKTIVVYLVLLSIVISFVPLFFINWEATLSAWLHHQPLLWLSILILAGVMSWIYQLARTQAVAKVKVGQIMPLSYTGVVFAGLLGWVFFHEIPDTLSLIGAVLVVSGTLCCIKPDSRSKSNSA